MPYCKKNSSVLGPFTLAKSKIQKTWGFCCTVYTARKTHNIWVFWHEKRNGMREKNPNLILVFGKWCACATSLYLCPYVVRITSRAAVGWFRRRSRTTWPKTRITPARLEQAFKLAKKNPEKPAEFQKIPLRRWVFLFGFFAVFRGSCLATSHKKPRMYKRLCFFYASVLNGSYDSVVT